MTRGYARNIGFFDFLTRTFQRPHIFDKADQTNGMSKRKFKKIIEDVVEGSASANECTGAFQKVALDPDEVKKFHEMYNSINGEDSID